MPWGTSWPATTAAAVKAAFDVEVVTSLEPGEPRDRDKHPCFVFVIGDEYSARGV